MQTRCPQCQTLYRISKDDLAVASGQVICSTCLAQFDAYKTLDFEDSKQPDEISTEEKLQQLVQKRQKKSPKIALTISIILTLLIPLQLFFFNKDALAQNLTTRPLVLAVCKLLQCKVADYADTSKIEIISRKVHSHPLQKGALIITTTLMNAAPQKQPFPRILISMADVQGKTRAQRLFEPEEYLPETLFADQGMIPGIPLNIDLEIEDPGQNLVAFEIDFL